MKRPIRRITNALRILFHPEVPPDLIFFVTSRCNCTCAYCLYRSQVDDPARKLRELDLTEIESIAANYGPLTKLSLSGGEPFVRRDIPEIVAAFDRHCRPSIIDIPTNGFFTERIEKDVLKILSLTDGHEPVIEMQLSIDGPSEIHDTIRGVKGIFKRAMATYAALDSIRARNSRLRIKMNLTYQPENQDAVLRLTDYMERHCRFDRLQITFPHGIRVTTEAIPRMSYQKYLAQSREILRHARVIRSSDLHSLIFRAIKIIKDDVLLEIMENGHMGNRCGAGKRILVIDDMGLIYPCEPLWEPIGNLRETEYRINPILRGPAYEAFVKRHLEKGQCNCTWGNVMLSHIVSTPAYYPRIAWHAARLALIRPKGIRYSKKAMKIDIGTKQQVKSFYNKEWSYGMRSFSFEKGKKVFESIGIPEHSLSHKKVLDAGCGTGMYSVLLAKVYDSKVTAIDIEEECISIARHLAFSENAGHIIFKCISIVDLESDGNNYDTVISIGAVHHTNDALRCLESFYSVLKPGGECFISVIRSCMFTKVQKIIFNLYSKSPDFIKKIIYVLLLNLLRITAIFYHPLKTRFTDLNVGLRDALNCPYHQVEKDDHWCYLLSMAGFTETKKIRSWNIMGHQGLYYGKKEVGKGIEKEHGSKSL